MGAITIIAICLVLLGIKIYYDEKNNQQRLVRRLKEEWAQVPTQEYSSEKFESLQFYYKKKSDEAKDVDDITWNDVDMDSIYMLLNNTNCAMGEEYLYYLLRKLQFDDKNLKERNQLIEYFRSHPNERIKLQTAFAKMGKLDKISVYEYMNRLDTLSSESTLKDKLQGVGLIASILLIFIEPMLGGLLTVFFVGYNMISYSKNQAKFNSYLSVVAYIVRLLKYTDDIEALHIESIESYVTQIKTSAKDFRSFSKGAGIVGGGRGTSGSVMDLFLDYARMLFHIDIIMFYHMLEVFKKKKSELNKIFEVVGLLDSMIAVASFREMILYTSEPNLSNTGKPHLYVEEVYHPLIKNPVANSIMEQKCVLLTGSNASGKSTFIKTLAINAILSQTIYTSLSKKYDASFFQVSSSMALRDDIVSKESYYIVEIKSLKRILDRIDPKIPTLCFVDEILRGTNTLERIAASSEILRNFARTNVVCFAATHDIELTHILEDYYSNYHFQEQIVENQILFDYKLYKGKAVSKNAIKLLSIMGYSKQIIDRATDAANHFLTTGEWDKLVEETRRK